MLRKNIMYLSGDDILASSTLLLLSSSLLILLSPLFALMFCRNRAFERKKNPTQKKEKRNLPKNQKKNSSYRTDLMNTRKRLRRTRTWSVEYIKNRMHRFQFSNVNDGRLQWISLNSSRTRPCATCMTVAVAVVARARMRYDKNEKLMQTPKNRTDNNTHICTQKKKIQIQTRSTVSEPHAVKFEHSFHCIFFFLLNFHSAGRYGFNELQ